MLKNQGDSQVYQKDTPVKLEKLIFSNLFTTRLPNKYHRWPGSYYFTLPTFTTPLICSACEQLKPMYRMLVIHLEDLDADLPCCRDCFLPHRLSFKYRGQLPVGTHYVKHCIKLANSFTKEI